MVAPKKIIIQDLELADEEIKRLRKENKNLKRELDVVKGIKNSTVNVLINNDTKIKELEEENNKLKLHIEAKDKAYITLLKEYEQYKSGVQDIFKKVETKANDLLDDLDNVIMNR